MANTKSAAKSARQSIVRHNRNASVISAIKSRQKKLNSVVASGDAAGAKEQFEKFASALDKAAKRGIIHRNVASRRKSRLNKALAGMSKAAAA